MKSLTSQIEALPPEAQKLVGEFVKLLNKQYRPAKPSRKPKKKVLDLGDFVGMWKDRPEMADSVAYVRKLRKREWKPRQMKQSSI